MIKLNYLYRFSIYEWKKAFRRILISVTDSIYFLNNCKIIVSDTTVHVLHFLNTLSKSKYLMKGGIAFDNLFCENNGKNKYNCIVTEMLRIN